MMNDNLQSGHSSPPERRREAASAFYIGWQSQAPDSFSRVIKKFLIILLPLVIILGIVLALSQKKFSTSIYEYGTLTEVKGIYYDHPVPSIKVSGKKDIWGHVSYITIPLVGYGKYGADGVINEIEEMNGISLNKKEITLKGTLLYNDGKLIMQIDNNDNPFKNISAMQPSNDSFPQARELGLHKVKGEIVDPKCYFGVMKPGHGKPHRDCAIRCILGGIPPVMRVQNERGESNYYLIVGPNGEKMNEAVKDYVAEPTEIEARLVQYDDWIVMYVKNKKGINRISGLAMTKPNAQVASCSASHHN